MPPQQQVKQQMYDLFFPISGLAVDIALEQQTPDTTPTGVNVRAFEPLTQRARGGSRSGISKYLFPQVPPWSVGEPIQHLGVVIDPQASALGVSYPPGGGGYPPLILTDPGAVIFPYGSGFLPSIPPNVLIITAKSQSKAHGTKFTFAGTEFTSSGLQSGDTINFCDFQCAGSPASASLGPYPIYCSNANISYGGGHTGPAYYCLYAPNTMTVRAPNWVLNFVVENLFPPPAPPGGTGTASHAPGAQTLNLSGTVPSWLDAFGATWDISVAGSATVDINGNGTYSFVWTYSATNPPNTFSPDSPFTMSGSVAGYNFSDNTLTVGYPAGNNTWTAFVNGALG